MVSSSHDFNQALPAALGAPKKSESKYSGGKLL